MRLTHGIDLVDIERFRRWLEDPRSKLRERFTAKEVANAAGAEEAVHLAGRFGRQGSGAEGAPDRMGSGDRVDGR